MRRRWATFGAALAVVTGCAGSSPGAPETAAVAPTPTRRTAPAVDLPQLPALGIAVTRGDGVDFYSFAGKRLGRVSNAHLVPAGFVRHPWVLLPTKRFVQLPTWRATTAAARPPRVIEGIAAGCVVTDRRGSLAAKVCARSGDGSFRTTLSVLRPGTAGQLIPTPPDQKMGHWRYALISPDRRYALAQWSGECESQSSYVVDLDGGQVRSVGHSSTGRSPETAAVGWTAAGVGIVNFLDSACGSGAPKPGIYTIDTRGRPLRQILGAAELAFAWS